MPKELLLLAAAMIGAVGLWALVGLERRDRPEVAVHGLLLLILVQVALYPIDADVPDGPFRPGPFRILELYILAALAARVWVRGMPKRISASALAWTAFFAWYATAAVVGKIHANNADMLLFHAKAIVYIGGSAALVAGVRPVRLLPRRGVVRLVVAVGVFVVLAAPLTLSGSGVAFPPLSVDSLGVIAPDGASLLLMLGALALAIESGRRRRSTFVVAAGLLLLLAPLLVTQRASVVHLVFLVLVLLCPVLGRTWSRRVKVTPSELVVVLAALLSIGVVALLLTADEERTVPPVVTKLYESTFAEEGKVQSAESRQRRWSTAWEMFREAPVIGAGLGTTYDVREANGRLSTDRGTFDNVPLDVLVRAGIVGLGLLAVALAASLRDGWMAWHRQRSDEYALVALACTAAVVGLAAKGVVESVMEKSVLMVALGLLIGLLGRLRSGQAADDDDEDADLDEPAEEQETWSVGTW